PNRHEARRNLGVNEDAPILLFVGNLTTQKRPDRFLRIAQKMHRIAPKTQAWLLGDGPLRTDSEKLAASLGIASATRFLGYQERVAPYLSAADLLVVSSDSDGIPAVILEAGMLALPTVATRVGGIPECVRDGETGLLVDAGDENGLGLAVASLLSDPLRRAELGAAAQRWVESHFGMETVANQYLAFYRKVIGERGRVTT
ncbi:MAG: glycosyltransferase, partial [Caldilineaceae bacterium]|nr:glycosyltransferase [Caldilineaceae bacterium]